ncbi:MAG: HD domain-containing protein [Desulfovibrionaceae bacterium]|jgi:alpha-D-ribose 1-methylphosphonate 5-triphosphate synthase subunit PhnG|nr:HD domain-containing protein [Desulfovibrionaceae bacterium]
MEHEAISIRYLEISPNILASFPRFTPPVPLYAFDEKVRQLKLLCRAEQRLTRKGREELEGLCEEGLLYLARADYKLYAAHLSKNLGLVLTEDHLSDMEVAEIFLLGLAGRLEEFYAQPIDATLEILRKDVSVLAEFVWAHPDRTRAFRFTIGGQHTLYLHSARVCLLGMALYAAVLGTGGDRRHLGDSAMAFLLHDIGMTALPEFVTDKDRPLFNQEKVRMREHPDIGVRILERLGMRNTVIETCAMQHHERMDGTGYPSRMRGDKIHPLARVCAVVDAFCAMTSERKHAGAKTIAAALAIVTQDPGFDPKISARLAAFLTD